MGIHTGEAIAEPPTYVGLDADVVCYANQTTSRGYEMGT